MTRDTGSSASVEVEGLGYTYSGRGRPALADISFTLAPGTITLVVGRSGSGKSTLLRALAGLIPNQSAGEMRGAVRLSGLDTRGARPADLAQRAGLVLQSPDEQICTTRVDSEVAFGLANLCLPPAEIERRVAVALERFDLAAQRARETQTLSGGQKQRLLLASILSMRPGLLLVDEPLARLDGAGVSELLAELARLRDQGLTIVVAEHRIADLVALADRVLIVDQGQLIADCAASAADLRQVLEKAGLRESDDETLTAPRAIAAGGDESVKGTSNSRGSPSPRPSPAKGEGVLSEPLITVLRVGGLAKRFASAEQPVWQNVSFQVMAGERVAVVGPNGSGKSTLLHVVAGQARATAGEVQLAATGPGELPLALVPQNPDLTLFCRTVSDELAFGPQQLRLSAIDTKDRVHHLVELLAIDDLLAEPPQALSQGQRLRVAVAAAASVRPRLLMLDEPTTGQDERAARDLLAALGRAIAAGDIGAVLFATHDGQAICRLATRVIVLAEGGVMWDGATAQFLSDDTLVRRAGLRTGAPTGADRTAEPFRSLDPATRGDA